jgi:hypothetical protein
MIVTQAPYVHQPPEEDEELEEDELDELELEEDELDHPRARTFGKYVVLPLVTIKVPEVAIASYLSISHGDSTAASAIVVCDDP